MKMTVSLSQLSLAKEIDTTIHTIKNWKAELFENKEVSIKLEEFLRLSIIYRSNCDLFTKKVKDLKFNLIEYANALKNLNKHQEEENLCQAQIKICQNNLQSFLFLKNLKEHCVKLRSFIDDLNKFILLQNYDKSLDLLKLILICADEFPIGADPTIINIHNSENIQNTLANYIIMLEDIYQIVSKHLWNCYIHFMHNGTINMKICDSTNNSHFKICPQTLLFYTLFKISIYIENYGKFKHSLSAKNCHNHSLDQKYLLKLEPFKSFVNNITNQFVKPLFIFNYPNIKDSKSKILIDSKEFNNPCIKIELNQMSLTQKEIFYASLSKKVQALFDDIKSIFTFLEEYLNSPSFYENMLFPSGADFLESRLWFTTFKNYLLDIILDQHITPFYKANIPHCLEHLSDYEDSLKCLKNFEEDMEPYEKSYRSNAMLSLLETDFASKIQEYALNRGRECLMNNSIHQTISGNNAKFDFISSISDVNLSQIMDKHMKDPLYLDLKLEHYLPTQSTSFTDCQISESIAQFKDLICEMVKPLFMDKTTSIGKYSAHIFQTISELFHLYASLAPMREKGENLNVPLFAALSLNNTCYVAHFLIWLQTAIFTLQNEKCPVNEATNLTIYLQPILNIGFETFSAHLKFQTDLIKEIIQGYFATNHADDSIKPDAKHLKRFWNHLLNLQKIWEPCLPQFVTKKAIGLLLDRGVENIINQILVMDDISQESCDCYNEHLAGFKQAILSSSFSTITENNVDKCVIDYCPSWPKFNGLLQILSLPMQDIAQLWLQSPSINENKAEINGVNRFSAAELRHMIRAIFQNTEKRMEVLGKIC